MKSDTGVSGEALGSSPRVLTGTEMDPLTIAPPDSTIITAQRGNALLSGQREP